jgi:hypothetical protein
MATLIFYRMSEDAPLKKSEEKDEAEGYGSQELKLSTFFADWPRNIIRNQNGTVEKVSGNSSRARGNGKNTKGRSGNEKAKARR